eukprot:345099-Prymnesium_polylepis.1
MLLAWRAIAAGADPQRFSNGSRSQEGGAGVPMAVLNQERQKLEDNRVSVTAAPTASRRPHLSLSRLLMLS